MKTSNVLALSALVLGSAAFAKADTLSITGSDTYTKTAINFTSPGSVGGTSTGIFSIFTDCNQCVSLIPTLTYAGTTFTPTQLFTLTEGSNVATLTLDDILSAKGNLVLKGDATVDINGTDYLGVLTLTTQDGGNGKNDVTFSATTNSKGTPSPVPEPASLMLLGTGALGLAGVARRKFFKS